MGSGGVGALLGLCPPLDASTLEAQRPLLPVYRLAVGCVGAAEGEPSAA